MSDDEREYRPGTNVTRHAAPGERRGTIKYAVEFPRGEFGELEATSDARGVSVDELVREAVREKLEREKRRAAVDRLARASAETGDY